MAGQYLSRGSEQARIAVSSGDESQIRREVHLWAAVRECTDPGRRPHPLLCALKGKARTGMQAPATPASLLQTSKPCEWSTKEMSRKEERRWEGREEGKKEIQTTRKGRGNGDSELLGPLWMRYQQIPFPTNSQGPPVGGHSSHWRNSPLSLSPWPQRVHTQRDLLPNPHCGA